MNGRIAKKLRRYVREQEFRLSEKAFEQFKLWIRIQPLHRRLVIAFKIVFWRHL